MPEYKRLSEELGVNLPNTSSQKSYTRLGGNEDYQIPVGMGDDGRATNFFNSQYDKPFTTAEAIKSGEYRYYRGQRQSLADKWGNGIMRFVGKTPARIVEGAFNPFIGTAAAIYNQDASKVWDNALTNGVNDFGAYLDEEYPLYNTRSSEKAHGFAKLAYANTWAGDILDGVSYSVSAMASGSIHTKLLSVLAKASTLGKTSEVVNKLKGIDNAADKVNYIIKVDDQLGVQIKDGLKRGTYAVMGATTEAADNALSDSKEWYNKMYDQLTQGGQRELTEGEQEWLEYNRKSVGNTSFALNLPVIMADNWLTFGKAVFGKGAEKKMLSEVSDLIKKGADDVYTAAEKGTVRKVLDKTYGIRKVFGKATPEMLQEQLQYGITKGTDDFYTKKYFNPESTNFLDSMTEGMYHAFATAEGWDSGIIGGIVGGITGNAMSLKHEGAKSYKSNTDANVAEALEVLNKTKTKEAYKAAVETITRHANLTEEQAEAAKKGDEFEYRNKQSDLFLNYVLGRIKTGKIEDLKADLENFKGLSQEEFEKTYDVKLSANKFSGMKQSVSEFVQEKLNRVTKIESLYNSLENIAPNAPAALKDRLLYSAFALEDARERSATLLKEVDGIIGKINGLALSNTVFELGNYGALTTDKEKEEYRSRIKDSDVSPLDQKLVLDKLDDFDKLKQREKEFVKEYKALNDPKVQKELMERDAKIMKELVEAITKSEQKVTEQLEQEKKDAENKEPVVKKEEVAKKFDEVFDAEEYQTVSNQHIADLEMEKGRLRQSLEKQKEIEEAFEKAPNLQDIRPFEKVRYMGRDGHVDIDPETNTYYFTDEKTGMQYELPKNSDAGYGKAFEHGIFQTESESVMDRIDVYDKFVEIDGKTYVNNYSNPMMAINYDSEGNVISVRLDTLDGKPRVFKKYAQEIAYALLLQTYDRLNDENQRTRDEARQELTRETSQVESERKEQNLDRRDQEESEEIEKEIEKITEQIEQEKAKTKEVIEAIEKAVVVQEEEKQDTNPDSFEPVEVNDKEWSDKSAKKDITYYHSTTSGKDEENSPEHQKRWFRVTNFLRSKSLKDYSLVLVHKMSNSFGDRLTFHNDGDIVAVLHKDGKPYLEDGQLVYTSIPLPLTLDDVKGGKVTNKLGNQGKGLSDEEVQSVIDRYTEFRKSVLESKKPLEFKAMGTTPGVFDWNAVGRDTNGKPIFKYPVIGRLVETEGAISDVKLKVATGDEVLVGSSELSMSPGTVYIDDNGTLIPAKVAKLKEVEGAVDKVIELLKALRGAQTSAEGAYTGEGKYKGWTGKKLYDEINKITLFGNYAGRDHQFKFFMKSDGQVVLGGGKAVSLDNELAIKEFLENKYFRVSQSLLKTNHEFVDPITGKPWLTYKHYLMSNKDRADSGVPVGVNLLTKDQKQYKTVGIRYIANTDSVKESPKITAPEKTDAPKKDAFGFDIEQTVAEQKGADNWANLMKSVEETKQTEKKETPQETEEEKRERLIREQEESGDEQLDLNVLRVEGEKPASKQQLDLEEKWFRENFPNVDYKRVKGLIDSRAVGQFLSAGKILISNNAPIGTTYHEAFHVVFNLYLSGKEVDAMINDYRKRTGDTTSSEREVEEALAEEFRAYMNGDRTGYTPMQKSWFQKLIDAIRSLLGMGSRDADDLFKRIKSGYYKSRKMVVDRTSKKSMYLELPGRDSAWTDELMQSMNVYFFRKLFKEVDGKYDIHSLFEAKKEDLAAHLKGIYDLVKKDFEDQWAKFSPELKELLRDDMSPQGYIAKNWEAIKQAHVTHLKKYGLDIGLKADPIGPESEVDAFKDGWEETESEDSRGKDTAQYIEYINFSSKDTMSGVIKALLASLPAQRYNDQGKRVPIMSRFAMQKSENFSSVVAFLNDRIAGAQTLQQMFSRIEQAAKLRPELHTLLAYLQVDSANPFPEELSFRQSILITKFFQQFAVTREKFYTLLVNPETGNIYHEDSNSTRKEKMIQDRWMSNQKNDLRNKNSLYVLNEQGRMMLNHERFVAIVNNIDYASVTSMLEAYEKLGITFSTKEFTPGEVDTLRDTLHNIKREILRQKETFISDLFEKNLIKGPLGKLLEIESKYNKHVIDLQHISADGKTVYEINKNTYLSLLVNQIGNEGIDSLHHLNPKNNIYTQDSVWYKLLQNGSKIRLSVLSGSRLQEKGAEGTITSELSMGDLMTLSINSILTNKFPMIRASDGKLERAFEIDFEMTDEQFINQMVQYYKTDLLRAKELTKGIGADIAKYKDQAKISQLFADIVPLEYPMKDGKPDTSVYIQPNITKVDDVDAHIEANRKAIEAHITTWFTNQWNAAREQSMEYGVIELKANGNFSTHGISNEVAAKFSQTPEAMKKAEMDDLFRQLIIKSTVANIEQSKLFLGDLAFYGIPKGDVNKRGKGLTGPKKMPLTDASYNHWLNKHMPRKDGKDQDGTMRSIVYGDVEVVSEYSEQYHKAIGDKAAPYDKVNEADAQGVMSMPAYREMMLRVSDWTLEQEKVYEKVMKGEKLSQKELALFPPLKPQFFGPQTYGKIYVPTYYKLSLMPLIPSMIKGSQLEKLNKHMMDYQIDVSMFESANKVGMKLTYNEKEKKYDTVPFYNTDGSINTDNITVQETNMKYWGIQVDNAPVYKDKVTFGTQFRKLLLSNLFSYGNSKTIKVKDAITGEMVDKDTQDIRKEYNDAIANMTRHERQKLKERLTLEEYRADDGTTAYRIKDINVFKDILFREADDRDVANNVVESIRYALDGDHKALDMTLSKMKVENMLNSLVNNKVIRQKTFGDMKVQAASTGFELEARKFKDLDDKTKAMVGNSKLRFYHKGKDGSTLTMQIMLPHYFKELVGRDVDVKNIDKRLLELIGFRIPTQGLNSIESIEIAGFLPREAGNIVVTPSEITAKAGSDYDIDKLTLFFPNYIYFGNEKKEAHYVPTDDKGLKKLYDKYVASIQRRIDEEESAYNLIIKTTPSLKETANKIANLVTKLYDGREITEEEENFDLTGTDEDNVGGRSNKEKFVETFAKRKALLESLTFEKFKEQNIKKINQNRVIELTKEIMSSPDIFKEMITPNSAATLEGLAAKISVKRDPANNKKKVTGTKVINWIDNIRTGKSFWVGKAGVGITALHNTNHVLSQIANLYIADETAFINFEHNKHDLGVENGERISLAGEYDSKNDKKISEIISEFLNAYVDIAKDPFVLKLNATTETAGTWFYLIRAGVPVETVANFMNQPIIWEYMKQRSKNESIINTDQSAKDYIVKQTKRLFERKGAKGTTGIDYTDKLFDWVGNKNVAYKEADAEYSKEFYDGQLQLLDDFLHYEQMGKNLGELQKYLSVDTAGIGKNRLQARMVYKGIDKLLTNNMFGNVQPMIDNTPIREFYNTLIEAKDYYNELFLSDLPKSRDVLEVIQKHLENAEYTAETIGDLMTLAENELMLFLLETTKVDGQYMSQEINKLFYPTDGNKTLPQRVKEAQKDPKLNKNEFLKEMFAIITNDRPTHNLKMFSRKLSAPESNLLTDEFNKLFNSDPKLAIDIVRFGIMQSGLNNSFINFNAVIPAEIFYRQIANPIISKYVESNNSDITVFVDQFYRNNYLDDKLVPKIKGGMIKYGAVRFEGENNQVMIVKEKSNLLKHDYLKRWVNYGNKENPDWRVELYRRSGDNVYTKVNTLGQGMYLHEYYPEGEVPKVVIPESKLFDSKKTDVSKFGTFKPIGNTTTTENNTKTTPKNEVAPKAEPKFKWARKYENSYEVSSRGDRRFSAYFAVVKAGTKVDLPGKPGYELKKDTTIEELYQVGVKGHASIQDGKGKPPKNKMSMDESYQYYKQLWLVWAKQNPALMNDLRVKAFGKTLTDTFAATGINQAKALAEILNETTIGESTNLTEDNKKVTFVGNDVAPDGGKWNTKKPAETFLSRIIKATVALESLDISEQDKSVFKTMLANAKNDDDLNKIAELLRKKCKK
jgi:hypothetical protein